MEDITVRQAAPCSGGFEIRQKRVSAFVMPRFMFGGIANPYTLCSRIANQTEQGLP